MDNPTGIIHSVLTGADGRRAIVDVDASVVCPRCAAGRGCGAGLLSGAAQARRVAASVAADRPLVAGDRVELVLASERLLRATLIVYGLPLGGALGAAALAYLLEFQDMAAVAAAIAGLALGIMAGRWRLRQGECLRDFVPMVGKRLPSGAGDR